MLNSTKTWATAICFFLGGILFMTDGILILGTGESFAPLPFAGIAAFVLGAALNVRLAARAGTATSNRSLLASHALLGGCVAFLVGMTAGLGNAPDAAAIDVLRQTPLLVGAGGFVVAAALDFSLDGRLPRQHVTLGGAVFFVIGSVAGILHVAGLHPHADLSTLVLLGGSTAYTLAAVDRFRDLAKTERQEFRQESDTFLAFTPENGP